MPRSRDVRKNPAPTRPTAAGATARWAWPAAPRWPRRLHPIWGGAVGSAVLLAATYLLTRRREVADVEVALAA